jgi:hypothetical protein
VDGHDFGSLETNVYIYTNDPSQAFNTSKPLLDSKLFDSLQVAYRPIDDLKFNWLHPADCEGEFAM